MPTCSKCGSQVNEGVKFCGSCGALVEVTPGSTGGGAPASPGASQGGGLAPNVAALLTYLPICLIGLICAILFGLVLDPYKKNRFIRFHAWQSLALHVAYLVVFIGWNIVSLMLTAIAHFFAIITIPITILLSVAALGLMIFLMIKAYANESFKVPVLGDWAEKQAGKGE